MYERFYRHTLKVSLTLCCIFNFSFASINKWIEITVALVFINNEFFIDTIIFTAQQNKIRSID